jgi:PAS domain S-box-containing protein
MDNLMENNRVKDELFRVFADLSPLGISLIGKDGRYQYVNGQFTRTFGYTLKDIPNGMIWFEKVFPDDDDRQKAFSCWKEDIKNSRVGQSRPRTFTVRCKNGSEIVIKFRPVTMKSGDQFIIYEDITESQRLLRELKEAEERFQMLFEYAPDAYYLNDLKGNFIDGNLAAEKMIGYQREELIGKSFLKLGILPTEQIPKVAEHLAKNVAGQASGPDEFTLIRKDETRVVAEIRTYPIKFKEKHLVLGIARDITLRKRAERELQKAHDELEMRVKERTAELTETNRQLDAILEGYQRKEKALRKSAAKYKFITEWMADIVWTLDMDFNATYVSPSVERILGFTPEERKKQKLEATVTPESLARIMAKFSQEMERDGKQGINPNRLITIEVECYHRNGSTVWMENVVKAIRDKEGKIIGMHGVSRDITKRMYAQKKILKEKKRLNDALLKIKKLSGLIPICANCKKIRDDKGYWEQLETYIQDHSEVEFSHSVCPDCAKEFYPDLDIYPNDA